MAPIFRPPIFLHGAGIIPDRTRPQDYPLLNHLLPLCPRIQTPIMPDALDPNPEAWSRGMEQAFADVTPETVVIAHSLGGTAFLKFLAERRPGLRIRCLLTLAMPYWGPEGWDHDGFRLPPNYPKATAGLDRILLCQAEDDPVVEPRHLALYARDLPKAQVILLPEGGHDFCADTVIPVLQSALERGGAAGKGDGASR